MWRPFPRGISLANKCLLLFGGAVVLIVLLALSVPWLRMNTLVAEGQLEQSRRLAGVWERLDLQARLIGSPAEPGEPTEYGGVTATRLTIEQARERAGQDGALARALRRLERDPRRPDVQSGSWRGTTLEYRYFRAVRDAEDGQLRALLLMTRASTGAARLLAVNTLYLLSAGSVVLALAVLVFYLITHRIILNPVRLLKETAERVRQGDLTIRSEIRTGDEFEQLAETFNAMLAELQRAQDQLRANNAALDLKVTELSERNTALYEAARLKGEFLANVSHELRTPMNSVIGFGELLLEIAHAEQAAGDDSTRLQKRVRYLQNIVGAGHSLLEMINTLLEMAKIEAGKIELAPEKVSLHEACEGLIGLIHPLAERKKIRLKLEVADDLPIIVTDPQKFQQIIFNFLSNAVKFTDSPARDGGPGAVTLRAERLRTGGGPDEVERVRVSVIDNGPGIAPEDQRRIFDAFQQLDSSHTREHAGTGLGLAISRELAALVQGQIQLESELGRGSMFSLILPVTLDRARAAETRLESAFRGTLAGRRGWEGDGAPAADGPAEGGPVAR